MIRKFRIWMAFFALLLAVMGLLSCLAEAQNLPSIQDDADLLTAAEEEALYQDMLPICEYGTPLFWTTVETGDYEQLAKRYYVQKLGGGQSGTLFVINMAARQLTVMSDGAIYRVVTDGEAETVTDNVYRLAGREEYYACAQSVFQQIFALLQGEKIARPMKTVSNMLLALVLSLLGVYLYIRGRYEVKSENGRDKTAMPLSVGAGAVFAAHVANTHTRMLKQKKTNISSDSGHHGGGGFSGGGGGGGGGGGFSGGGGSHGF